MREVNKDFIACIHNNGRRAKYCEYEIEDFSYKIEELKDFVRSSSRSVSEIKSKYRELFTDAERELCRNRLKEYGYSV